MFRIFDFPRLVRIQRLPVDDVLQSTIRLGLLLTANFLAGLLRSVQLQKQVKLKGVVSISVMFCAFLKKYFMSGDLR